MSRILRSAAVALALAVVASGCVFYEQVSLTSSGENVPGDVVVTDVSLDGRYVVFDSVGQYDLADGNGVRDVFVRDTLMGTTTRVSRTATGAAANDNSSGGRISDDGSIVVYQTLANNIRDDDLSRSDNNDALDAVRVNADGSSPRWLLRRCSPILPICSTYDQATSRPDISGNGLYAVFETDAELTNLGDSNGLRDIVRVQLSNGARTRMSVSHLEEQANGDSVEASINFDGSIVGFSSMATNLVPTSDTNGTWDVFLRTSIETYLASRTVAGVPGNLLSTTPRVSGLGTSVAFTSSANNLVAGDTNGRRDVFVFNLLFGTTERASVDDDGSQRNTDTETLDISASGQRVLFRDGPGLWIRDLATDRTDLANRDGGGVAQSSSNGALARGGDYLAFDVGSEAFIAAYPEPQVMSASPAVVARGTTTTVVISGSRLSEVTEVVDIGGVTWSNVVVIDDNTVRADATVGSGASLGMKPVGPRTPDGGPGTFSASFQSCACLEVIA